MKAYYVFNFITVLAMLLIPLRVYNLIPEYVIPVFLYTCLTVIVLVIIITCSRMWK